MTPIGEVAGFIVVSYGAAVVVKRAVDAIRHPVKRTYPREPVTDMNPAWFGWWSGRHPSAYTAPVRAVTPGGIAVRIGRCCARGHQSPVQAIRHADVIAERIARTGR